MADPAPAPVPEPAPPPAPSPTPDPAPVPPPAPLPDPIPAPDQLSPDQLASLMNEFKTGVAVIREMITIVQLLRAHNVAGALGELKAAFLSLASSPK